MQKAIALQRAITQSAQFSSIATDERGVIQLFNVGAERLLGYLAAEVINKLTPSDISDPQELVERARSMSNDLGEEVAPGLEALVFKARRRIEDIYEQTYIRKDGSRFPAVVSVTALRDEQDQIIGYLLIGTDNTARKQAAEDALRFQRSQAESNEQLKLSNQTLLVSQENLRVTLNSIGDAVITTDANARVTLINPTAERLTGYLAAEATGHLVDDVMHTINKETRQRTFVPVTKALVRGTDEVLSNRTVLIARDSCEHDIADSCSPIAGSDGEILGAVMVFRDVTAELAAQQALKDKNVELERATAKAEQASLAKSTFLSSISHELRTPLNAILGFSQLLEAGQPALSAQQDQRLQQILKAGWYLLELINEILDLAVIESGKLSLSRESVSLSEIMGECQSMIETQAQTRGISVTFQTVDSTWYANVDRTRVKQIVINLLSNAIKYNRENGSVEVSCVGSDERLTVSRQDTGHGVSPVQLVQ
jgi:PAS domain S-box-containing protein